MSSVTYIVNSGGTPPAFWVYSGLCGYIRHSSAFSFQAVNDRKIVENLSCIVQVIARPRSNAFLIINRRMRITNVHCLASCRSLAGQGLTGELPNDSGLWSQLSSLMSVNFSGNQLSGYIPASLAQSPALTSLDLSSNTLSGPLPPLTSSSQLQTLNLGNNQLSGASCGAILTYPGLDP